MAGGGIGPLGVAKKRAGQYKGRMAAFVVMACLVAAVDGDIFANDIGISASGEGTRERERRMRPISTIHSQDGDIMDCLKIYDQPSLKNPLLKDHKLKLSPLNITRKKVDKIHFTSQCIDQTWHKSGSCPFGTIPILRTDLDQNTTMQAFKVGFGMKYTYGVREAAVAYARRPKLTSYGGLEGVIDVWQPHAEPLESSLAYILLGSREVGGTEDLAHYVSTGWRVSPSSYGGDGTPRAFVSRSGSTGYNLNSGFIQTSQRIIMGGRLTPVSVYGGQPKALLFTIRKDLFFNWWVYIGREPVGYFPNELFESFREGDMAQFGGILLNTNPGGKHTTTQMGSGHFSGEGETKAGKISSIFTSDYYGKKMNDFPTHKEVTNPNCYDLNIVGVEPPQYGYSIYYGGPGGRDPRCTNISSCSYYSGPLSTYFLLLIVLWWFL